MKIRTLLLVSSLTVLAMIGVWAWRERSRVTPSYSQNGDTALNAVPTLPPKTNSIRSNEQSEQQSDPLSELRALKDRTPDWSVVKRLTSADEPVIIDSFLSETNILDRRSWIWAMAAIGGSNSVEVLWQSLTNNYKGEFLSSNPSGSPMDREWVLLQTAQALGLVAQRADNALPLLVRGSDPAFWKSNITWQSARPSGSVTMLTSECIQALGLAGRSESFVIINEARRMSLTGSSGAELDRIKKYSSSFVQAAFYQSEIKRVGVDAFMESYFRGQISDLWYDWSGTPEGSNWVAWSRQLNGLSSPAVRARVVH